MKWFRHRVSLVLLLLAAVATTGSALVAEDAPTAAGKGLFVAVGYGGRRMSSADGVHWQNDTQWSDKAADNDDVLFNVACGQGKFVAVGGGAKIGHILVTRDGKE